MRVRWVGGIGWGGCVDRTHRRGVALGKPRRMVTLTEGETLKKAQ